MSRAPRRGRKPEDRVCRLYPVASAERLRDLCGPNHDNLEHFQSALEDQGVTADSQGGGVMLCADAEDGLRLAETAMAAFERLVEQGASPDKGALQSAVASVLAPAGSFATLKGLRRPITPQTEGQAAYVRRLTNPKAGLVFGVGPAGTGKTFLAVAAGVSELLQGARDRLVVTRPAVEAGEKLGFLPGTLEDKVDPYMLPIWDSLRELMGQEQMERRIAKGEIEVAPLAFMRGRTLKKAFVIVDEAQNTSVPQMKMVLTRLGENSRMVVTGDPGQVDLPRGQVSGLADALRVLNGVEGVHVSPLTAKDVRRHALVGRIIDAYDADDARA